MCGVFMILKGSSDIVGGCLPSESLQLQNQSNFLTRVTAAKYQLQSCIISVVHQRLSITRGAPSLSSVHPNSSESS